MARPIQLLMMVSLCLVAADMPPSFTLGDDASLLTAEEAFATARDKIAGQLEKTRHEAVVKRHVAYSRRITEFQNTGDFKKAREAKEALEELTRIANQELDEERYLAVLEPRAADAEITYKVLKSVKHGGRVFGILDQQLTWHQAREFCMKVGGRLAIAETQSDYEAIRSLVQGHAEEYLVGATDEVEEGKWLWVNGRPVTITLGGLVNNEDGMEHYLAVSAGLGTNDVPDRRSYFICEWIAK